MGLRVKRQVKTLQAVQKEGPFVIFYSVSPLNAKRVTKALLEVILVSLTLKPHTVFVFVLIFEKTQAILWYCFAAQQQTVTCRRKKFGLI